MNPFLDWQDFLQEQIQLHKPKTIVEFGLGEGTELFTRLADKVYSIELACRDEHIEWFNKISEDLKDHEKWKGYIHNCEDEYTSKVRAYINLQLGRIRPDFVFVDPGVHFRGQLVNQCVLLKIPMIAAHDTNFGFEEESGDAYFWKLIVTPGYEKIHYQQGQGTTLWIKNNETK